jgi:hypothetical protein
VSLYERALTLDSINMCNGILIVGGIEMDPFGPEVICRSSILKADETLNLIDPSFPRTPVRYASDFGRWRAESIVDQMTP